MDTGPQTAEPHVAPAAPLAKGLTALQRRRLVRLSIWTFGWTLAAALWSQAHLRFSWSSLAILVLAVPLAGSIIVFAKWLGQGDEKNVAVIIREWLLETRWRTVVRIFTAASVVLFLAILTISSVRVPTRRRGEVTAAAPLAAILDTTLGADPPPVHCLALFPFGRLLRIDVNGHLPASVRVWPIVRGNLWPEQLVVEPVVLIRVPRERLMHVSRGYVRIRADGRELIVPTAPGRGAIVLGDAAKLAEKVANETTEQDRLAATWRKQVTSLGLVTPDAERVLAVWSSPIAASTTLRIRPGMTLEASFFTRAHKEVVRYGSYLVTKERVQEVPPL